MERVGEGRREPWERGWRRLSDYKPSTYELPPPPTRPRPYLYDYLLAGVGEKHDLFLSPIYL